MLFPCMRTGVNTRDFCQGLSTSALNMAKGVYHDWHARSPPPHYCCCCWRADPRRGRPRRRRRPNSATRRRPHHYHCASLGKRGQSNRAKKIKKENISTAVKIPSLTHTLAVCLGFTL